MKTKKVIPDLDNFLKDKVIDNNYKVNAIKFYNKIHKEYKRTKEKRGNLIDEYV